MRSAGRRGELDDPWALQHVWRAEADALKAGPRVIDESGAGGGIARSNAGESENLRRGLRGRKAKRGRGATRQILLPAQSLEAAVDSGFGCD